MSKEVALSGQFEGGIPAVLDAIDQKIASLAKIETTKFKTDGQVTGFPNTIQKEDKVDVLIRMFSSISGRAAAFEKAATDLGVSGKTFNENGNSVEDFKTDIKLQIAIVTQKDELKKLRALKEEGSKFLSQEDQKAVFISKLMKEMGA